MFVAACEEFGLVSQAMVAFDRRYFARSGRAGDVHISGAEKVHHFC
jgi:hypothetical protein